MRYRPFGGTGWEVSEVGLGTWQLGGADWGDVDEAAALETLAAAADAGVNFFDTADVYGLGRSEALVGRFVNAAEGEYFLATKLGRFPEPGWPGNFTLEAFREHTEASLRRLGVESIDLMQLHCIPIDLLRGGEVFDWLRLLRDEGKIKEFGVSVESLEEAEICMDQPDLASLQVIFNIFRPKPSSIFERARRRGIAVIVRLPLASGLLTGKYTRETRFPPNDHRNFNRDGEAFNVGETFGGIPFEIGLDLVDSLRPLVPADMTMTQMALRWVLDHDEVTVAIPGARNAAQARANAMASELRRLDPELHARLDEIYRNEVAPHIRGPY